MRKLLLLLLGFGAIAYALACFVLYLRQTRLLFFPQSAIEITPAEFGLAYKDVWLPVTPGSRDRPIHAWWLPASQSNAQVLLYLHGNAINIGSNVAHAERFHQMGFSVLLMDYRGYGKSRGDFPNEASVYQDAQAGWNYLVNERQIAPEQIVIYGHSLGGAIAIDLAMRQPQAAALIVQSSFSSIRDMVSYRGRFSFFPVNLILTQRFDSLAKVPQLKVPVLYIHGANDLDVPALMSQALYDASPQPKKLWLVPQAAHNNVGEVAGPEFHYVITAFLQQLNLPHSRL